MIQKKTRRLAYVQGLFIIINNPSRKQKAICLIDFKYKITHGMFNDAEYLEI
jgi:hypothetical protein